MIMIKEMNLERSPALKSLTRWSISATSGHILDTVTGSLLTERVAWVSSSVPLRNTRVRVGRLPFRILILSMIHT